MANELRSDGTLDWLVADLDEMLPGDKVGGFEGPADWDSFGRLVSLQMLAIYYGGSSRAIDQVPDESKSLRGYGTDESATRLGRLMTGIATDYSYSLENLRLVYAANSTEPPSDVRSLASPEHPSIRAKRPPGISGPIAGRTHFIGYADLRPKASEDIEVVAGVHFTLDLFNIDDPTLITAGRHSPRQPIFAKDKSGIYPGVIKPVTRYRESLESAVLDLEFDRDSPSRRIYIGQKAIDRILATQTEGDIKRQPNSQQTD